MPVIRLPSVSMQLVRLAAQHLAARGVEQAVFRRSVGVSELELSRADGRFDLQRFQGVRRLVEEVGRIEDFDRPPPAGWIGWVAQAWPDLASVWFNSPSLGAAVRNYARYRPLIGEVDRLDCGADADRLVLDCTPNYVDGSNTFGAISHLLMIDELIRYYRSRTDLPILVRFEVGDLGRSLPRYRLSDLVKAPVRTDAGARSHRIIIEGRGLWASVEGHHALIHEWSTRALEIRLRDLDQTSSVHQLASRVGGLVTRRWADSDGDGSGDTNSLPALFQGVADDLGVSRWTLRRQLAANGLKFSNLVEELRGEHLPILLTDPSIDLLEAGRRLGFTSQSAFSRYYRARYGHPPSRDPLRLESRAVNRMAPRQTE